METTNKFIAEAEILRSSICKKYFSNTQQPVSFQEFIAVVNQPLAITHKEAFLHLLNLYYWHYAAHPKIAKIVWEICHVYLHDQEAYFKETFNVSYDKLIVYNQIASYQKHDPKKLPFVIYEEYINISFELFRKNEIPVQVQGLFLKYVFAFLKNRPFKPLIISKNFKKLTAERVLQTKSLSEFLCKKSLNLLPYFITVVNTPTTITIKEALHELIQGFCNNCGISKGKRTLYWDIAWEILTRNKSLWKYDDEDPDLSDYIKANIENSAEYLEYDVAVLNGHQFIRIAYTIIRENEIRPALYPIVFRYFLLYYEEAYFHETEDDF